MKRMTAEMQTSSALLLLLLTMSDPLPFPEIRAELHILEFQLLPWPSQEEYWSACANGSELSGTGLGIQAQSTE